MAIAEARSSVGFLDLPPEIRLCIYRRVLPAKATITIESGGTDALGVPRGIETFFNLMRVNRQLHAESGPLLYAHFRYEVYYAKDLKLWLKSIQGMKQHVRNFVFHFQTLAELRCALHCLKPAVSSLQSITIVSWVESRRYPKRLAETSMPLLCAIQRADLDSARPRSLTNLIRIRPAVYEAPGNNVISRKVAREFAAKLKAELEKLFA